jgi:hypothetical protein
MALWRRSWSISTVFMRMSESSSQTRKVKVSLGSARPEVVSADSFVTGFDARSRGVRAPGCGEVFGRALHAYRVGDELDALVKPDGMEQHQEGDGDCRTMLESLISVASRAADIFEHSMLEPLGAA